MEWNSLLMYGLPALWAVMFIVAAFLMRFVKNRAQDGTKRFLFYLTILAVYSFASGMPVILLAVVLPIMLVLNAISRLRGKWYALAVLAVGLALGGFISWWTMRFAADRDRSMPVVNDWLAGDLSRWRGEVEAYAALPFAETASDDPARAVEGEGRGHIVPEPKAALATEEGGERFTLDGTEYVAPAMPDWRFRAESGQESTLLRYVNGKGETFVVLFFAVDASGAVFGRTRDAYADEAAYAKDLETVAAAFPESDFMTGFISPPRIVQDSENVIAAGASLSVIPASKNGVNYGYGFDVEAVSGAFVMEGKGMRVFMIAALHDMYVNLELPLMWLNTFVDD